MHREERRVSGHERATGVSWAESYRDGPAPWQVGQPQPGVIRLVAAGAFVGPVLDAGCGSGENALHIAAAGAPVFGIDVVDAPVATAREQAAEHGVAAEFAVADALRLDELGRRFATVLDCGLFHALDAAERTEYVTGLAAVTDPGANLYLLCFSDEGPDPGPHPVTRQELADAFTPARGWQIRSIESDRLLTRFHAEGAPAWLATIERVHADPV